MSSNVRDRLKFAKISRNTFCVGKCKKMGKMFRDFFGCQLKPQSISELVVSFAIKIKDQLTKSLLSVKPSYITTNWSTMK